MIQNLLDKKWVWRLYESCEYLWILKVLRNYLEMNCVLNSCNLWALYVLPLYHDMWLLGDYLARYYSLCDIGILALVFVMVIEFRLCDQQWVPSLWRQISSIFVTVYEFHLCDGRLVLVVCWQWVLSFWQHCHVALGWMFKFWNDVLIAHSI